MHKVLRWQDAGRNTIAKKKLKVRGREKRKTLGKWINRLYKFILLPKNQESYVNLNNLTFLAWAKSSSYSTLKVLSQWMHFQRNRKTYKGPSSLFSLSETERCLSLVCGNSCGFWKQTKCSLCFGLGAPIFATFSNICRIFMDATIILVIVCYKLLEGDLGELIDSIICFLRRNYFN